MKLPGGRSFALTGAQDRKFQQRDQWVSQRLRQLIDAGRVDAIGESESYDPPKCQRPQGPVQGKKKGAHRQVLLIEAQRDPSGPRLKLPRY
jgi:hypothetical protein